MIIFENSAEFPQHDTSRVSDIYQQLGNINQRIDRLYEVIVRREEHMLLTDRVRKLEEDMALIKEKIAA
ncbi:MAG: hypothetical protein AB1567_13490 [bacterium]